MSVCEEVMSGERPASMSDKSPEPNVAFDFWVSLPVDAQLPTLLVWLNTAQTIFLDIIRRFDDFEAHGFIEALSFETVKRLATIALPKALLSSLIEMLLGEAWGKRSAEEEAEIVRQIASQPEITKGIASTLVQRWPELVIRLLAFNPSVQTVVLNEAAKSLTSLDAEACEALLDRGLDSDGLRAIVVFMGTPDIAVRANGKRAVAELNLMETREELRRVRAGANEQLASRDGELSKLHMVIMEKDSRVSELETALSLRNTQIGKLETKLAEKTVERGKADSIHGITTATAQAIDEAVERKPSDDE